MTRYAILGGTLAVAVLIGANAASASKYYDDAYIASVKVFASDLADQAGPNTFYEKSKLKMVCQYGYLQTGSGGVIPWVNVHLYVLSSQGVPLAFSTTKGCLSETCSAEGYLPTNIGTGGVGVGCMVSRLDGADLKDANPANNKKEVFVSIKPRPGKPVKLGRAPAVAPGGKAKTGVGIVPGLSGNVKQCRTSLVASVKVDPHEFASPLNSPAEQSQTKVTLYLQKSELGANSANCHYATNNKDVPNLVVTINCPNASPQGGQSHSFTCGQ